jgi:RimJ/RimL family protein N-acetyltransferase
MRCHNYKRPRRLPLAKKTSEFTPRIGECQRLCRPCDGTRARKTRRVRELPIDSSPGRSILKILETERLVLRRIEPTDAAFYLELVNDPSWIRFIGDRGLRTPEDARDAILKGPVAMHERLGFSLYLVELKDGSVPIGICGLIKRDSLPDVDIGFAFLPRFGGKGYAHESARAVMHHAQHVIGLKRIVAITKPGNESSIKLLEKIGLTFEKMIVMPGDTLETRLFSHDF